jgi:hypothetical protein
MLCIRRRRRELYNSLISHFFYNIPIFIHSFPISATNDDARYRPIFMCLCTQMCVYAATSYASVSDTISHISLSLVRSLTCRAVLM